MSIIKFNFEDQSIPSREFEFTGTDISVLELTEQFDIHLNHNCGGVSYFYRPVVFIFFMVGMQFMKKFLKRILSIGQSIHALSQNWLVSVLF
ncbi:MAG: hypothetical protein U0T81_10925 [Saprospiraceae bacterium]